MDGHKVIILSILFTILMTSFVSAELTSEDKAYINKQTNEIVSKVNSKIDTTTTRIEKDLDKELNDAEGRIMNNVNKQIKSNLTSIVVGLGGIMIVVLAGFKVIDLRLSTNKTIKRYEDELKKNKEEFEKLVSVAKKERKELEFTRQKLIDFKNNLKKWEDYLEKTQSGFRRYEPPKQRTMPKEPDKIKELKERQGKGFSWKKVLIGFLIVLIIAGIVGVVYKFFLM